MLRMSSATCIWLACAALTLVGFGCKPILDAQVARQNEVESRWVLEEPRFDFEWLANYTGTASVTLRTQAAEPAPVVVVRLDGPGVAGDNVVAKTADKDGTVKLFWPINRVGRYTFTGTISYNNVVMEGFEGEGDAY